MKESPILFSAPMVRAIINGTKTQTRRVVNPKLFIERSRGNAAPIEQTNPNFGKALMHYTSCPYGQPGDVLWVRETFCIESSYDYDMCESFYPRDGRPTRKEVNDFEGGQWFVPWYKATDGEPHIVPDDLEDGEDDRTRWKPSIHMPRWASRIDLLVKEVRVQRLQYISEDDAKEEGVGLAHIPDLGQTWKTYKQGFENLWNSINEKRGLGWDANPWVWVVTFERIK